MDFVKIVTEMGKDGIPYLGLDVEMEGYHLVKNDDEYRSHNTIRSDDGEIDITVHICELAPSKTEILVVANFVGSGMVIRSEICETYQAEAVLNGMITKFFFR